MNRKEKSVKRIGTKKEGDRLGFGRLNYVLMAVGLGMIIVGYIFLAMGDITIAPVLLVLGYCGVLPAAILIGGRSKKKAQAKTEKYSIEK